MAVFTQPGPTVRQLSMGDDPLRFALSVLVKRTYAVSDDGVCTIAAEQEALTEDMESPPEDKNLIERDLDLIPLKQRTDVIVRGHAYSDGKAGVVASVAIGSRRKNVLVVGDRRATLSETGGIVISKAEPFDRMPVSFDRAYGGRDRAAEKKYGNPFAFLAPFLTGTHIDADNQSPYLYPKNPCGRGFLIEATREAVEACALPNLEDPDDPLTPDRIVVGHPLRWIYMPAPQGLGWVSMGWFPRLAWSGMWPDYEKMDRAAIPEIQKGLFPKDGLREAQSEKDMPPREHQQRVANGAPLDMQFPFLAADEAVELSHLHPRKKKWVVRLPGDRPKIWTDGRNGKLNATSPVLHSVVIEPDAGKVTVIWRGSAPAIRPYFEGELAAMPLRVEW